MRLRLYKRRAIVLAYDPLDPIINFLIPNECDTLRVEKLTGDLTLNLFDPAANDGDYLKLLLQPDQVAPRTVTIGGLQGAPLTIPLTTDSAVLYLVFHSGEGKYIAVNHP